MKQNQEATPSAGYASPSVRLITIRTRNTILVGSDPTPDIYNTDPTEMEEKNVF